MSLMTKQFEVYNNFRNQGLMQTALQTNYEPGQIHEIPDELYFNWPGINQSSLKDADVLAKYFAKHVSKEIVVDSSKNMDFGKLAHAAILEPNIIHEKFFNDAELIENVLQQRPELKSVRASKEYKAEKAKIEASGKTVLDDDTFVKSHNISHAVHTHPLAKNMLNGGKPEAVMFAKDPETGLLLKTKMDYILMDGYIIDVKTTDDASDAAIDKRLYNLEYYVQVAFYTHIARLNFGDIFTPENFIFINVEQESPHLINCKRLDEAAIEAGEMVMKHRLQKLARGFFNNNWPGYAPQITTATLPGYAWSQLSERYGIDNVPR